MTEQQTYDGPTEIVQTTNLGTPTAFCSVRDIHAYYAESYIVQGVSFNIHEGEILALLGRNGAGKTSTLRAIARCDDPEVRRGEIWLDHEALHTMPAAVGAGHASLYEAHSSKERFHVGANIRASESFLYGAMVTYSISYHVPVHRPESTQHGDCGLESR